MHTAAAVRFVVVHVSGEKHPCDIEHGDIHADSSSRHGGGPECEDESTAGRASGRTSAGADEDDHRSGNHGDNEGGGGGGRWKPGFLEAELREMCLRQLEIPVPPAVGSTNGVN